MSAHFSAGPLVLDTNVVLDCFVFQDPRTLALRAALDGGLAWLATTAMRDELAHVLARGLGARWPVAHEAVMARFDRQAMLLPQAPAGRLACSDGDDQKFIDLALAHRAPWLLTRDRALLRLARRARDHGVAVAPPESWQPALPGTG